MHDCYNFSYGMAGVKVIIINANVVVITLTETSVHAFEPTQNKLKLLYFCTKPTSTETSIITST